MGNYSNVDVNINIPNLTRVINNIDNYTPAIERGIRLGIDDLSNGMNRKVREFMTAYGLGDSPLMGMISITPIGIKGIKLEVGGHAMYVEYGTGIVGSENPHPHPWIYDVNNHGEKGWFYPTTESDPNPNKHYYNGVLYAWTKGQRSRPFMYKTWLWAKQSCTQIIRKHIYSELRKVGGR